MNQFKAEIILLKEELRLAQDDMLQQTKRNNELMQQLAAMQNGTSEIGHELQELRETHDRDRVRIMELEQQVMAAQERGNEGVPVEQFYQLEQQLTFEQGQRQRLEQDLTQAKKQLSDGPLPTQREENFIQDLLFTIDSEIALTPEVQGPWIDETTKLNNSYQYEMQQMQSSYIESLAQIASELMPEHIDMVASLLGVQFSAGASAEASATEQQEVSPEQPESDLQISQPESPGSPELFSGINADFQNIIDEYLRSGQTSTEYADVIVNRLKDRHDRSVEMIDDRYKELYGSGTDVQDLKLQYQFVQASVERSYVEALQQLDEYLGYADEDQEHEAEALQQYPVPVQHQAPALSAFPGLDASPIRQTGQPKLLAFLWGSGKDGRCGSGTEDKI